MSGHDCGCGCGSGGASCGCACDVATLSAPVNRAGLTTIEGRLGDYRDFFGDAVRRLSDPERPAVRELGTRELDDPTIALLDAWAIVADILTFYRERLTNEGYLRTARDEYAIRELAALIGFIPRPGVSATAHLAYLMENTAAPVNITAASKAQTVPGPGEQMQTFETRERLMAFASLSRMLPRVTRPARITLVDALLLTSIRLRNESGMLVVRPGERVLFMFGERVGFHVVREVEAVNIDVLAKVVELRLKPRLPDTAQMRRVIQSDDGQANSLTQLRDRLFAGGDPRGRSLILLNLIGTFFLGGTAKDAFAMATLFEASFAGEQKAVAGELRRRFEQIQERRAPAPLRNQPGTEIASVLPGLARATVTQAASGRQLTRGVGGALGTSSAARLSLLTSVTPSVKSTLSAALDTLPIVPVEPGVAPTVFLFRGSAAAFGASAPPHFVTGGGFNEHELELPDFDGSYLETVFDGIAADSFVVMDQPAFINPARVQLPFRALRLGRVRAAQTVSRSGYTISTKSTRLDLVRPEDPGEVMTITPPMTEIAFDGEGDAARPRFNLGVLRSTVYHVHSELVTLADAVVDDDVKGGSIELQERVDGLVPGRFLIVSGDRADVKDAALRPIAGLRGDELAMVAGVRQEAYKDAPGDTLHTVVELATPLAYAYKRATTVIYGNVSAASHGETVKETLGSGEASTPGQRFTFSRTPLTFTPALTTSGVESSDVVRVNGIRYHRVESLLDARPDARAYQMDVDADGSATLRFGDGVHAARLPSGDQNVRAEYRVGLGALGNVRAEQISLLTDRPLGVTGVVNPIAASGGADRDDAESIRRNAPLAALALSPLSRLISVTDYAHFARRFAGIGQANAVKLSDGAQPVVLVTVAGVNDVPLAPAGELMANLRLAFEAFGDPALPIEILTRELKALVLEARVAIDGDYRWDAVEPVIRRRLLDTFSADSRALGRVVYLSEIVAVIQAVPGVVWVDVDRLGGITEHEARDPKKLDEVMTTLGVSALVSARQAGVNPEWAGDPKAPRFLPAQLVFMLPDVTDLVALNLVSNGTRDAR